MHISQSTTASYQSAIADGDVIGISHDGMVLHYDAENGTHYQAGLTLQDWLDGHSASWLLTEEEASRIGIDDYDEYAERVRALNPRLFGLSM